MNLNSLFHMFSVGFVAHNKHIKDPAVDKKGEKGKKKRDEDKNDKESKKNNYLKDFDYDIEIYPIEHFAFCNGEVTDNIDEEEIEGKNFDDEEFKFKIEKTATIRATWLPISNTIRKSPPDVRRGERVFIYRYADSDKFYWVDTETNKKLRKLETIIFSISNVREEDEEEDENKTYWVEWSTHKKLLHIHTSKNDKEPFEYDIQLNCKDGCLTIKDDDGNYIFMDSSEQHIKMQNRDESFIEINKKIINMEGIDEINLKTKKYTLTASDSIVEKTKDFSRKSEKDNIETKDRNIKSNKEDNKTTDLTITASNCNYNFSNWNVKASNVKYSSSIMELTGKFKASSIDCPDIKSGTINSSSVKAGSIAGGSVTSGGKAVKT